MKKSFWLAALLMMTVPAFGNGKVVEKTSLAPNDCKRLDRSEVGSGGFELDCPGLMGFKVIYAGADAREWLEFSKNDKRISLFEDIHGKYAPGHFVSITGDSLEWRIRGRGAAAEVFVIFQASGQDPEDFQKTNTSLLIARLDHLREKACVIASADTIEKAREIADSPSIPCHASPLSDE